MFLGIVQRYVIGQVLRAFLMALVTLTAIIVLFMLMAEAARQGLAPQAILKLIPFIVPSTLPYTVPVALLFAVSVIYGRLASDNEIIALKAAGCSAWTALGPSLILAGAVSVALIALSGEVIPRATFGFKETLFKDTEESFFLFLKREREFNNPAWSFFISVKDVDMKNRVMIGPTFKHRARNAANPNTFDVTVQADKGVVHFDAARKVVLVDLTNYVLQTSDGRFSSGPARVFEYAMPDGMNNSGIEKRVQEMTNGEMRREHARVLYKLKTERARQALAAGLWVASGRIDRIYWPDVGNAYRDEAHWVKKSCELQTESHVRLALACGAFCFVLLGSPVGILFARRDFLSAFITCFIPIIVLYYPLVLAGINMGKEGVTVPWVVWSGDLVLLLLASLFALPPVLKH